MRGPDEIKQMMLACVQADERVRAVVLTGSRADPAAADDPFRDYDVAFFVTEMDSFTENPAWVDRFGERVIMQMPEAMELFPPDLDGWFTWLMLFCDGVRIDLMLAPVADVGRYYESEAHVVPWLDKDGLLPGEKHVPFPLHPPTAGQFADCCNELFWISTYVAKGLWRGQLLYAAHHLEHGLRPMLLMMLRWQAGVRHGFGIDPGKSEKNLERYLPPEEWAALCATLCSDSPESCWHSMMGCIELFRTAALQVAGHFGFAYPRQEDERVTAWLQAVQAAPPGTAPDFT